MPQDLSTEGTVLLATYANRTDAEWARCVLDEASEAADVGPRASLTLGGGGLVQATVWVYVATFLLMVPIILTGLLVGL